MKSKNIKNIIFRIFLISLFSLLSCFKNTSSPAKTIIFNSLGYPSSNSLYLVEQSIDGDQITLNVSVKGVTNIRDAALEIIYDASKISYVSAAEGNYLNSDGSKTFFSADLYNGQQGSLLIGIAREKGTSGISGDGILCTVVLKAITAQTDTPIEFNQVYSGLKSSEGMVSGIYWINGRLTYQ